MEFLSVSSWPEALQAKAAHPGACPIAGGTDVMVELNFNRRRPPALLDLTRVSELKDWSAQDGSVRLGAGVTYTRVIDELGSLLPGLAIASRTVGSPQIRNRGTIGGNLGSASPAGDAHPPLLASRAVVEVASARGHRDVPIEQFFSGPKCNVLAPDELVGAVRVPAATGPQQFSKVGNRNAMVIAIAAFALSLAPETGVVGTGIGSAAPTPRRAVEAEVFLAGELSAGGWWESRADLPEALEARFSQMVSEAASPIDDVRGTSAYRHHALGVMARRTLRWAWSGYQKG